MSEPAAPPPAGAGEPDRVPGAPVARATSGDGGRGLRARLDRWRRADGWAGLWPSAARDDPWGWFLRELLVVGLATAAVLGSIAIAAANRDEGMELNAVSVLVLAAAVVALPFRHRYPAGALVTAFTATLVYVTFYAQGPVWIPLVVTFGQAVLTGRRRLAVATALAGYVLFLWLGVVVGEDAAPSASHLVGLAAWLAFLLSLTEVIRARQERAREEARSKDEALRRRVTEERLRIARDLHDVVAHNMSLISIQAGVALHLMDQRPEQARESLTTIKAASKEALVELRSILGVLRHVDEVDDGGGDERGTGPGPGTNAGPGRRPATTTEPSDSGASDSRRGLRSPAPSLQRLSELVERARATGVEARVESDGDLDGVPRDVGLAAYRIIQESLTNVARHSDDKRAQVRIRVDHDVLTVEVLDEGTLLWQQVIRQQGRHPTGDADVIGSGHGVAGMRERAASVGGILEAGPRPGRGFAVRARLPLDGGTLVSADSEETE